MALSVQNRNFLAALYKLDIDVKGFPDKTFDALFDYIPESINYFFNWFMENIDSDNALTQSEQATYFQLESSNSLPSEEEVNYVLSSWNPGYEELMSLDINYVNNYLPQEMNDLSKNYEELSQILDNLESTYDDVKHKENSLKEELNLKRKQFSFIKENHSKMITSLIAEFDEVYILLMKQPEIQINFSLFNELLDKNENICSKFNFDKILENDIFNYSVLDELPVLEEKLVCVESALILSEGFLKEKKSKIDCLMQLLEKKASQNSLNDLIPSYLSNDISTRSNKEIKQLEKELLELKKKMTHNVVQNLSDSFLLSLMDLHKSCLLKLTECKDKMKSIKNIKSYLLHILLQSIKSLEIYSSTKKNLHSKINKYGMNFSNDISNLELRKQRFKDVSLNQNKHPLLIALRNVIKLDENLENNEETFKNLIELISLANGDPSFTEHKLKNDLQYSIKSHFHNLCGPANQVLFVPVDLLKKFQICEEYETNLSQVLKRLASKYVYAKETISKSDRKRLLLWIDFLINPQVLTSKVNHLEF